MTTDHLRELAHVAALLPVVAVAVVAMLARVVDRDQLILAAALAMSYVGDSLARVNGAHLWAAIQLALVYAAVVVTWNRERVGLTVALCAVSLWAGGFDFTAAGKPSILLIGGAALIGLGRHSPLIAPIFVYFGLGSVAYYVWMKRLGSSVLSLEHYHADLLRYQGCRVAAILLFCVIIIRTLYTEEEHAILH